MGSLMAGWGSHVEDPKSVRYRRNKSLTNEEIETFWKTKKKVEEEHLQAISSGDLRRNQSAVKVEKEIRKWEDVMKTHAWWTRSSWAFLNEPPVTEGAPNRYSSQLHVANVSKSFNPNHGLTST